MANTQLKQAVTDGFHQKKLPKESYLIYRENIYIKTGNYFVMKEKSQVVSKYGDCRILNGRKVLNRDWMYCDALMAGDLVENDVVDDFMNCLPPACYRSDCAQLGEAHSTEKDHTGKYRSTYLTFKRFDKETWEFCGYCFRGENISPENKMTEERRTA